MFEELPMCQVQGIFFPAHQQHMFHRLNLEYLVSLQPIARSRIYGLLAAGLRSNWRKLDLSQQDYMLNLRPQLDSMALQVTGQAVNLVKGREALRKQFLNASQGNFLVYRAGMEADFASKKLSESLTAPASQVQQQVTLAEHLLKHALAINHHDYRAHFELGWLYLFVFDKLNKAEQHFTYAARYAEGRDTAFANLAWRHLADVRYGLGKFGEAVETLARVLQATPSDPEPVYEYSRYLVASGEAALAVRHLSGLINRSPLYYMQAQCEQDFAGQEAVTDLLEDLRANQVRQIRHQIHHSWQESTLATLALPEQIDSKQVFNQVIEQHLRVMTQLPYITLNQREQQIGKLILATAQKRIQRELQSRSRQYERVVEQKRSRWRWINKTGGVMLHTALILMLAALMFFLIQFAFKPLGFNLWTVGADRLLGISLLLAGAGSLLFQFVPFDVKKLLRKQLELDNTVTLLQSSS